MRRGAIVILASGLVSASWIGCNAILGNEEALFSPDAAPEAASVMDAGASTDAAVSSVYVIDGSLPDALSEAATCEGDFQTNPHHCGACFHDCIGGECIAGKCQPFVVATDDGDLAALAVGATHVFWGNNTTGALMRAPIGGGAPELVYGDAGVGSDIVVYQAHVYFSDASGAADRRIARCPDTGCDGGPETVVAHVNYPTSVRVLPSGTVVFAEGIIDGRVGRCAAPPCLDTFEVVADHEPFPLRVNGSDAIVVWSNLLPTATSPVRVRVGDAAATTVATGFALYPVEIIRDEVVFGQLGGRLRAVLIDGGSPRFLASTATETDYLAVEGTLLYYADRSSQGSVYRIDVNDVDASTVIAARQQRPRAVATDSLSVYWINTDTSKIMRVAK